MRKAKEIFSAIVDRWQESEKRQTALLALAMGVLAGIGLIMVFSALGGLQKTQNPLSQNGGGSSRVIPSGEKQTPLDVTELTVDQIATTQLPDGKNSSQPSTATASAVPAPSVTPTTPPPPVTTTTRKPNRRYSVAERVKLCLIGDKKGPLSSLVCEIENDPQAFNFKGPNDQKVIHRFAVRKAWQFAKENGLVNSKFGFEWRTYKPKVSALLLEKKHGHWRLVEYKLRRGVTPEQLSDSMLSKQCSRHIVTAHDVQDATERNMSKTINAYVHFFHAQRV